VSVPVDRTNHGTNNQTAAASKKAQKQSKKEQDMINMLLWLMV
jgi:hypothetical protein